MNLFSPSHYTYVIIGLRGLYIGKGSGDRIRESMKERHGFACFKIGRYFTASGAYRAESQMIRRYRRLGLPLQNGRAPGSNIWWRLSSRRRRRRRSSAFHRLIEFAAVVGIIW